MPNFDINSFKANFSNAARQYLFYIMLTNPVGALGTDRTAYLVRSGSAPEGTIDPVEVNWQGMTYKLGTTHTFADWSVTFAVDTGYDLYSDFLAWQRIVHDPQTNAHGDPSVYMQNQEVWLLNTNGTPTKKMIIAYAWPQTIGELTLDYSAKEIQTFDVTFSYLYHYDR